MLEAQLQTLAASTPERFPNPAADYHQRYATAKDYLDRQYYASTAASLASGGVRYTKHDIKHVDDVIRMAGRLLGLGKSESVTLEPFEVYVLLLAILLHDAGNAVARQGHEKHAHEILAEIGALIDLEPLERRQIALIAQAHGGTVEGDKDTIGRLLKESRTEIAGCTLRPQALAAVLRFADELADNPRRADEQALGAAGDASGAAIHNQFCKAINVEVDPQGRDVKIGFLIDRELLDREYTLIEGENTRQILLVDYIAERLQKCDRERRYCGRFLYDLARFDRIRVRVDIADRHEIVKEIRFDLEDVGYPTHSRDITAIEPSFDGRRLRDEYGRSAIEVGAA